MTHTRIQPALVAAFVAVFLAPLGAAQDSRNFACPSSLVVAEQAEVPHGWSGTAVKTEHLFKTAKIYNGDPGKDEFDLKPDDQAKRSKNLILSWRLKDYRDMNLFIRCSYYDSSVTVTANIPSAIDKCSVTLELTASNQIVGKSQMKCQ